MMSEENTANTAKSSSEEDVFVKVERKSSRKRKLQENEGPKESEMETNETQQPIAKKPNFPPISNDKLTVSIFICYLLSVMVK